MADYPCVAGWIENESRINVACCDCGNLELSIPWEMLARERPIQNPSTTELFARMNFSNGNRLVDQTNRRASQLREGVYSSSDFIARPICSTDLIIRARVLRPVIS